VHSNIIGESGQRDKNTRCPLQFPVHSNIIGESGQRDKRHNAHNSCEQCTPSTHLNHLLDKRRLLVHEIANGLSSVLERLFRSLQSDTGIRRRRQRLENLHRFDTGAKRVRLVKTRHAKLLELCLRLVKGGDGGDGVVRDALTAR
jgi:hypothetical protein